MCWRSIQLVSFRFDLFRFVLFRFVSICFVSFRSVSFRFDLFRFVSICFVSFRFVSVSFRTLQGPLPVNQGNRSCHTLPFAKRTFQVNPINYPLTNEVVMVGELCG